MPSVPWHQMHKDGLEALVGITLGIGLTNLNNDIKWGYPDYIFFVTFCYKYLHIALCLVNSYQYKLYQQVVKCDRGTTYKASRSSIIVLSITMAQGSSK